MVSPEIESRNQVNKSRNGEHYINFCYRAATFHKSRGSTSEMSVFTYQNIYLSFSWLLIFISLSWLLLTLNKNILENIMENVWNLIYKFRILRVDNWQKAGWNYLLILKEILRCPSRCRSHLHWMQREWTAPSQHPLPPSGSWNHLSRRKR